MKTAELRKKTAEQLLEDLKSLLKEQFSLRMQKNTQETIKPHLFKNVRRSIAKIKTVLHEKAREESGNE